METEEKSLDKIVILDFGSQTTQLIARRIRSQGVYAEIVPFNISYFDLRKLNPKGIILSGGPASLYDKNSPRPDGEIFEFGVPFLGICYGLQLIADKFGGEVVGGHKRKEYGDAKLSLYKNGLKTPLFSGWEVSG